MDNQQRHYTWWDDFFATGFYSGHIPFAPGTMGALTATLMWWIASCFLPYNVLQWATAVCIVLFTLVSIPSIRRLELDWGEDPSRVVVDEVVGVWICLLGVPTSLHWGYVIAAFALFRFFDIVKPLGVRRMERVPAGWGVMLDDILAGIYGLVVILLFRWIIG